MPAGHEEHTDVFIGKSLIKVKFENNAEIN
jgi:hypothetical protein